MAGTKNKGEVYKCNVCGNIVEVLHVGGAELVCCGQPMELMEAHTKDEGKEKHVPVIEEIEDGYKVKVGSVPHPMEEAHFIEWIELVVDGVACKKYLNTSDQPEAEFHVKKGSAVSAREYCNVHGLWGTE